MVVPEEPLNRRVLRVTPVRKQRITAVALSAAVDNLMARGVVRVRVGLPALLVAPEAAVQVPEVTVVILGTVVRVIPVTPLMDNPEAAEAEAAGVQAVYPDGAAAAAAAVAQILRLLVTPVIPATRELLVHLVHKTVCLSLEDRLTPSLLVRADL